MISKTNLLVVSSYETKSPSLDSSKVPKEVSFISLITDIFLTDFMLGFAFCTLALGADDAFR